MLNDTQEWDRQRKIVEDDRVDKAAERKHMTEMIAAVTKGYFISKKKKKNKKKRRGGEVERRREVEGLRRVVTASETVKVVD